jgi:cytochrome d ubiquinol oxidase subunit II
MLTGLVLRGVAFEYRHRTEGSRWIWDIAFPSGSLVAAFIQGMMVGALVEGLPIADGQYTGGEFGWLSPFAMLCGVGFAVFVYALAAHLQVMDRWLERPYLLVFPIIGAAAAGGLAYSVRYRRDRVPFSLVALTFAAAFGTLAISFWPYMIPFSITIDEAAAPHASLAFMFWGEGLFVFPLMLIYAAVNYAVFRGKIRSSHEHY